MSNFIRHTAILFFIMFSISSLIYGEEQEPGTIDGAEVQALESNMLPKRNGISVTAEAYPFNPFYNAIGASAAYQFYFTKNLSWEVIRGTYAERLQIDTSLMNELAEKHNIEAESIEKLSIMLKSNLKYYFVDGKFLWFENYIRYCRVGFVIGPGLAFTVRNKDGDKINKTKILGNAGLVFELYLMEHLMWTLDFQETLVIKEWVTMPSFSTGFKVIF